MVAYTIFVFAVFIVLIVAFALLFPGGSPLELLGQINAQGVITALGLVFVYWLLWSGTMAAHRREQERKRALAGDLSAMPLARPFTTIADDPASDSEPLPLTLDWRWRQKTERVVATEQGLTWRRGRGREKHLPWTEARLFELWDSGGGSDRKLGFSLYWPSGQSIDWYAVQQNNNTLQPIGVSLAEIRRRERALIRLISERTGLPLRTLAPSLQSSELNTEDRASQPVEQQVRTARRYFWLGMMLLALFVVVPLAEAAGILLVPLSSNPLLNYYAAGTTAALGVFILAAEIVSLRPRRRTRTSAPTPLVLPAVLPQPDDIYRIRWTASWRQRAIALVVGLVLLANVAPLLVGYSYTRTAPLPFTWLPDLHKAVIYTLGIIVLLGAMFASMGVFERAHAVVADQAGLVSGTGKEREVLFWSDVASLRAHAAKGKIESFKVIGGDIESTIITWPATARWERGQAALGQPDAGPALAAIVAERTGLRWTTVSD